MLTKNIKYLWKYRYNYDNAFYIGQTKSDMYKIVGKSGRECKYDQYIKTIKINRNEI